MQANSQSLARPGQIIQSIPADLTQSSTSMEALEKSSVAHGGRVPDHIYLCAGFSKPKFMIDSTEEEFKGVCPLLLHPSCLISVFVLDHVFAWT